jgi:DNA polymerase-1
MLASYLLDATRSSHPLEELALEHAGYKALSEEDVCGRARRPCPFRAIALDKALNYAGERADLALQLEPVLLDLLEQDGSRRSIGTSNCR